jgi:hypothetical protein
VEYTDETYMVLGQQLVNPYSIPVMTQAYNAYFAILLPTVPVTHHYLRINATTEAQIALLDDSLELDLYTHPLDHELLQDGDLYVPPGGNIEDMPVLYTVVPLGYTLPTGIPYTVLSDLHLPEGPAALMLEEMAESIAAGASYSSTATTPTTAYIVREDVTLPNGNHPAYTHEQRPCAPTEIIGIEDDPCPDPGGGGITPPPPPPTVCGLPGLACMEPGKPSGRVRVRDTQLGICEPVADVKIRTKNWFKIRNTRTNALGEFYVAQSYSNRVKVNLIFRNDEVSVRPLRNKVGIRLSLFPITYTLGVFTTGCGMNTVEKVFERPNNRLSKGFEAWLACNAINSRKEQINFSESPAEGLKAMKDFRLNVYLQKYGAEYFSGPQAELLMQNYIWRKREGLDWLLEAGKLALYYFSNDVVGFAVTLIGNVLGSQKPDIMYSYNTHPDNPSLALQNLSSNEVKQKFYDVYTQAGILKATNNNVKWKNYYKQQSKMIDAGAGALGATIKNLFKEWLKKNFDLPLAFSFEPGSATPNLISVGSITATLIQQIIAVINAPDRQYFEQVNGFSDYYGHRMCALRYGTLSDPIYDQKRQLIFSAGGLSSHEIYLETWRPNVPVDFKQLERVGLYHDLLDNNEDEVRPVDFLSRYRFDQVSSVTVKAQFYSITGSGGNLQWYSPETYLNFADNLKSQFPLQLTNLNNLFIAYLIQAP